MTTLISKAEKSYIQAGIAATPPSRADGRGLETFRTISLQTDVAPLANGSARLTIGPGGTEILAATKLEVESTSVDHGRILCNVTCSPAAYPSLSALAIEDLQSDYTSTLHSVLSHPSLLPKNLIILPLQKCWLLHLDLVVLADTGNVFDALFMAARAALWDTKVPRTRRVEYRSAAKEDGGVKAKGILGSAVKGRAGGGSGGGGGGVDDDMDVDDDITSSFDTRQLQRATDFELDDYWDEGEILDGRNRWPVCITLNIISPTHFLDATLLEEASTPLRLLLMFSFLDSSSNNSNNSSSTKIQGIRTLGSAGELTSDQLSDLIKEGENYAREIWNGLDAKLKAFGGNQKPSKGKANTS